jgi:Uma2 family endonuclease
MVSRPMRKFTEAEYLALERASETKSEYVDGYIYAMGGAASAHVLITVNIVSELRQQLKGRPCRVYSQDLRVRISEGNMYAYPDAVIVCGAVEFADDEFDVLLNPTLIVEVLSPSTEAYDRGLKAARYRQRPSLQEYVLVAQDRVSIERYGRNGEAWALTEVTSIEESIDLPSIGCTLALRDIYDTIDGLS